MKTVAAAVLALITAYLVGRWWFAPSASPRPAADTSIAPLGPVPAAATTPPVTAASPGSRGAGLRAAVPLSPTAPGAPTPTVDDRLEAMMTEHRASMLLLVEAFHYEHFKQGGELAKCGDGVPGAACWLRFQCVIRGQAMTLHVEHVECRAEGDGLADTLTECVAGHLRLGDPLGIPAEAAEDLGDYDGPLEIPLRW